MPKSLDHQKSNDTAMIKQDEDGDQPMNHLPNSQIQNENLPQPTSHSTNLNMKNSGPSMKEQNQQSL